jgi:UDP-N-acetyl-D-mannosaminuronic acid dehydrogenase
MAAYGVGCLEHAMASLKGKTVLILGLAYRPNVKESANSSAFLVARALEERGATALVHDPLFSSEEIVAHGLTPPDVFPPERADAIIVQAWHDAYRDIELRSFRGCQALLDGRAALDRAAVESAGLRYLTIGG